MQTSPGLKLLKWAFLAPVSLFLVSYIPSTSVHPHDIPNLDIPSVLITTPDPLWSHQIDICDFYLVQFLEMCLPVELLFPCSGL